MDEANQKGKGATLSVSVNGMVQRNVAEELLPAAVEKADADLHLRQNLQEEYGEFAPDLLEVLKGYVVVQLLLGMVPLRNGQTAAHELQAVKSLLRCEGEAPILTMDVFKSGLVGDGGSVNRGRFNGIAATMGWFSSGATCTTTIWG